MAVTVSLSEQIAAVKQLIEQYEQLDAAIPKARNPERDAVLRSILQSLSCRRPLTQEMVEAGIAALGSDNDRDASGVVVDVYRAMEATWLSHPMSGERTEGRYVVRLGPQQWWMIFDTETGEFNSHYRSRDRAMAERYCNGLRASDAPGGGERFVIDSHEFTAGGYGECLRCGLRESQHEHHTRSGGEMSPYEQGVLACCEGLHFRRDLPFKRDTKEAAEWLRGYAEEACREADALAAAHGEPAR